MEEKDRLISFFLGIASEKLAWSTFLDPFHKNLWFALSLGSLVLGLLFWVAQKYRKNQRSANVLESIWIALSSTFGISIDIYDVSNFGHGVKMIKFITLLWGSLLFNFYLTSLTSVLSFPNEYKPFTSPEELTRTNFKYFIKNQVYFPCNKYLYDLE